MPPCCIYVYIELYYSVLENVPKVSSKVTLFKGTEWKENLLLPRTVPAYWKPGSGRSIFFFANMRDFLFAAEQEIGYLKITTSMALFSPRYRCLTKENRILFLNAQ